MKEGRDLNALLAEVLRQSETKRDYLAPSRCLAVTTFEAGTSLELATTRDLAPLPLKDTAHGQLAERFGVKKLRARDLWHLCHRTIRKVLGHTVAIWLGVLAGHRPLQFDLLLTD